MEQKSIKGGSFKTMNLNKKLLYNIPFKDPTPIQRKVIPIIFSGKNVMGVGRTGSGKTYCYLIPSIQYAIEGKKVLVLVPTRELQNQVQRNLRYLSRKIEMNGNVDINTPGSVLNLDYNILVVDEIDRILEEPDLKQDFDILNEKLECQKIFFSATKPNLYLNCTIVEVDNKINENVSYFFFYLPSISKESFLLHLLMKYKKMNTNKTIIFVSTKYTVDYLLEVLMDYKYNCRGIYSSMDSQARLINYRDFCKDVYNILIVTDVAARGLDIPLLDSVINYDLCDERTFLHRVGRIRGVGTCMSMVTYDDIFHFFNIQETYMKNVEIGLVPSSITDEYDMSKYFHIKARTVKGYEKCLKYRSKVSVPEEYKSRISGFSIHSLFKGKDTLGGLLQNHFKRAVVIRKEEVINPYRDQLYIPYSRKDTRIHNSAFGIAKDDYVIEKKDKRDRRNGGRNVLGK